MDNKANNFDEELLIKKKKNNYKKTSPKNKQNCYKYNNKKEKFNYDKTIKTKERNYYKNKQNTNNKKYSLKKIPHSVNKSKKRLVIKKICLLIGILITIVLICFFIKRCVYIQKINNQRIYRDNLTTIIKSHYNKYVRVLNDAVLYQKNDENKYNEIGKVYRDTLLSLSDMEINYATKYFYSTDLQAYIAYDKVKPIDELIINDNRYKRYILFNENVITKDNFTLYSDDKKIYSFKDSMTFPIYIKDYDGKYYVEYNNRLLYLLKDDIEKIVPKKNSNQANAKKITTLCYHRVYDKNEKCNDLYICKKKSNFYKEMKYLKDNNFLPLTMEEVYLYLTKRLQIPRNSVVVTLDDGYLLQSAIAVLEELKLNATAFIKTAEYSKFGNINSPYLELHSHTHNMHIAYTCPIENKYQQGGGILCLPRDVVLNDLKKSREITNNSIAIAYPFYDYNSRSLELVKEAGFKLGFIGAEGVWGRSYPGINLYKIPRMTIWDTTSFNEFKIYVNN